MIMKGLAPFPGAQAFAIMVAPGQTARSASAGARRAARTAG
jgi:hypothetical protein